MSDDEAQGRGFTVVDKRGGAEEAEATAEAPRPELPGVDFSSFCLSLGTSALFHLGVVAHPDTGERSEVSLPLARQTIEALEMLEVKTRGNLEKEEAELLESLLYELRMRFVEAGQGPGGGESR